MGEQEHFRELSAIGRREGVRKVGRKAWVLAKLARAGMPMPRTWVLDARHFDVFAEGRLPRRHDLRSLIKLAGTRAGDEACARAYDDLIAAPLDEALRAAIGALWEAELSTFPHGVAVRPSLAASGPRVEAAGRHLHSRVGAKSPEAIAKDLREVWASAVLAWTVSGYAEADVKDVSLAVVVQEAIEGGEVGIITRTTSSSSGVGEEDWHVGVSLDAGDGAWRRRAQLLSPLSLGKGGAAPPEPLARLREALEPDGFEQLIELGEVAVRELGPGAVVHFAPERREGRCHVHVLNADASPRWLPLSGGDEQTTWTEITLAGRSPEPPMRLTQSIVDAVVESAVVSGLALLRCEIDDAAALISRWSGRSYLNLDALVEALRDVPLLTPEDVLSALGGAGDRQLRRVAGRAASHRRNRFRLPLIGLSALGEQLTFESELSRLERSIERTARGLSDLDVGIIPSDAIGTTLAATQTLLERSVELWVRTAIAVFSHHLALRALVGRRVGEVDPHLGLSLVAGAGDLYASTMADAMGRLVEVFRRDLAAVERLRHRGTRLPSDLPDGMARGALGQFLSRFGDLCFTPFELSRPRWREDARDVLDMVLLLLEAGPLAEAEARVRQAHATADADLARHEPALRAIERRALREMVDRMRRLVRRRANVDRLVLRSLLAARRVALDIDRRLRRIDRSLPVDGTFHCSAARLRAALKTGRPELERVIRMRLLEREAQSREPAPPLAFVASPPRGGIPLVHTHELSGIGVSPGVVEGRVRRVAEVLPERLEANDVLVVSRFEAAHAPLGLACAGVIAEAGGMSSPGAEALRELAVPAAFSVAHAVLLLADGERVRLDGDRGTVSRLEVARETPLTLRPQHVAP
jgi:rifampicin phosphotransferase